MFGIISWGYPYPVKRAASENGDGMSIFLRPTNQGNLVYSHQADGGSPRGIFCHLHDLRSTGYNSEPLLSMQIGFNAVAYLPNAKAGNRHQHKVAVFQYFRMVADMP